MSYYKVILVDCFDYGSQIVDERHFGTLRDAQIFASINATDQTIACIVKM